MTRYQTRIAISITAWFYLGLWASVSVAQPVADAPPPTAAGAPQTAAPGSGTDEAASDPAADAAANEIANPTNQATTAGATTAGATTGGATTAGPANPGAAGMPAAGNATEPAVAQPGATDAEARALYDRAFADLLAGNFDAASAGFAAAAARTVDPELRAAATELGRLTMHLRAQGGRFVRAPSPSADTDYLTEEDRTAGRTSFIISTTAASLYGGIVLIDLFDAGSDFRPVVGLLLGSTAAGFLGSYYGSRGREITLPTSDAYSLGLGLGAGNGLLLSFALLAENDGDTSSEAVQSITLGSMALAGATGMWLGHTYEPTRGQVTFTSLTSTLGIATMGLGMLVVQPDIDADTLLLALAGGLDAGALAGINLAPKLDWSLSRARFTGLGTFLGALVGWGTAALATGVDVDGDNVARIWGASTLAGMWGGFALTAYLTRNMTPDRRYLETPTNTALVVPMAVPDGVGLALGGRF